MAEVNDVFLNDQTDTIRIRYMADPDGESDKLKHINLEGFNDNLSDSEMWKVMCVIKSLMSIDVESMYRIRIYSIDGDEE